MIRLGLIGCGRMGRVHLNAAAGSAEFAVVAICDPAFGAKGAAPLPCPLLDFDELLASEIDALVIAAPSDQHAALVERCLQNGKHVLCEKPLTLDPAGDLALAERAAKAGLLLQIGFWRRFAEPYQHVRQVLGSGRIGAPVALRAAQWDAAPPPPGFCDPRVSGGIEIDCGVHEFDLARWLLNGTVEAVTACGATSTPSLEAVGDADTIHGLVRLSGNRMMTIDLTRVAGYRDSIRTEIIGTHGSVVAEFASTGDVWVRWEDRCEKLSLVSQDVVADAVHAQLLAFASAVSTGSAGPDAAGALDSRRALLAARALRRSRDTGAWCSVPI